MTTATRHQRTHTELIAAPADRVYDLVADVTRWPALFGPTIAVDRKQHDEHGELFEIWALVNGSVQNWESRRGFDRAARIVRFDQVRSHAPIAAMGGTWTFTEQDGGCLVSLAHEFAVVDDDPATVEWVEQALDRNSAQELASLRKIAELGADLDEIVCVFTDVVEVRGAASDAYEFVAAADQWPSRLPHVDRVVLTQDGHVQDLEMDTFTPTGGTHTTKSVRLCFPVERISYKQTTFPPLMLGHSGEWTFTESDGTVVLTSQHTVIIDPVIAQQWGGLAQAREFVRTALGGNSRTTLGLAASHAENTAKAAGSVR
jgi:ribosome-associated toxin RatA of RatAB toxin-antitoxin module